MSPQMLVSSLMHPFQHRHMAFDGQQYGWPEYGNYLGPSIVAAGLDPANLPQSDKSKMNFGSGGNTKAKAWRDIWGSGQGIGAIDCVQPAANYVARLITEYAEAKAELAARVT
jgi:nitronate monooxygenase